VSGSYGFSVLHRVEAEAQREPLGQFLPKRPANVRSLYPNSL
jgi:hypothetical protein